MALLGLKATGNKGHPIYAEAIPAGNDEKYSIWEHYQFQSLQVDFAKSQDWIDIMDSVLVFSGLFAAFLATFVTETTNDMELDPEKASYEVLLHISRQLANTSLPAYEPPEFHPDGIVYAANVLYYITLGLVLVTAFFATLLRAWARNLGKRAENNNVKILEKWDFKHAAYHELLETLRIPLLIENLSMLLYIALLTLLAGLTIQLTCTWWMITAITGFALIVCLVVFFIVTLAAKVKLQDSSQTEGEPAPSSWWLQRVWSKFAYSGDKLLIAILRYLIHKTPIEESSVALIEMMVHSSTIPPRQLGWTTSNLNGPFTLPMARTLAQVDADQMPLAGMIASALGDGDEWDLGVKTIIERVINTPEAPYKFRIDISIHIPLPLNWTVDTKKGIKRVLSTAVAKQNVNVLFEMSVPILKVSTLAGTSEIKDSYVDGVLSGAVHFHAVLCHNPQGTRTEKFNPAQMLQSCWDAILPCQHCTKGVPQFFSQMLLRSATQTFANHMLNKLALTYSLDENGLLEMLAVWPEKEMVGSPQYAFDALPRVLGLPCCNDEMTQKAYPSESQVALISRWLYTYDSLESPCEADFIQHMEQNLERLAKHKFVSVLQHEFTTPWFELFLQTVFDRPTNMNPTSFGPEQDAVLGLRLAHYRAGKIRPEHDFIKACANLPSWGQDALELCCKFAIPLDHSVLLTILRRTVDNDQDYSDMLPGWMFLSRELPKLMNQWQKSGHSSTVLNQLGLAFLRDIDGLDWIEKLSMVLEQHIEDYKMQYPDN